MPRLERTPKLALMDHRPKKPQREYIVPALPGWAVLVKYSAAGVLEGFDEDPVLAWRIVSEGEGDDAVACAYPVCLESAAHDAVLMRPDGKVIDPWQASWDSKTEYLAWLKEKQKLGEPLAAA